MSDPPRLPLSPPPPTAEPYRVDLTQGGLLRGLANLVWPIMLASMLQTLVGFVDVLFVGRLLNATAAIAAVSMCWMIMFVLSVLVFAVSTGAQVLVSRSVGARDMQTAQRATGQGFLLLGLTVGVLILPLGIHFAPWLLRITGATPELERIGTPYMRVMFLTTPAMLASFLFAGCMQGAGDSRSPLVLTAAINVINALLNWALIFGHLGFPAQGVMGSALGTFTARWLGAGAVLVLLSSGKLALTVDWVQNLRPDLTLWWRMLRIGVPSALQGLVRAASGWIVVRILAFSPDTEAVIAGNALAQQILMLTSFVGFSAMPAGMTVVGQNMGAGRPDRAETGAWTVAKLAAGAMLLPVAVYAAGAPTWVRMVGREASAEALSYAAVALRILAFGEPCWAINMSLSGGLRGGGDTVSPLVFTVITQLCMGIGGGALIVLLTPAGPPGLWGAIVFAMYAQAAVTSWWFRRGRWKTLIV
jgi:putative MATE family efflux protein